MNGKIIIPGEEKPKSKMEQIECPNELDGVGVTNEEEPSSFFSEDEVKKIIETGEPSTDSSEVEMKLKDYAINVETHDLELRQNMLEAVAAIYNERLEESFLKLLKVEGRMVLFPLLNGSDDVNLWNDLLSEQAECVKMVEYIESQKPKTFWQKLLFWR